LENGENMLNDGKREKTKFVAYFPKFMATNLYWRKYQIYKSMNHKGKREKRKGGKCSHAFNLNSSISPKTSSTYLKIDLWDGSGPRYHTLSGRASIQPMVLMAQLILFFLYIFFEK
jgi:hypothetical protein